MIVMISPKAIYQVYDFSKKSLDLWGNVSDDRNCIL